MKLTLIGHDDRYAVEQLQLALFPEGTEGEAVSSLGRSATWLTATTKITLDGKTAIGIRRLKASDESVRERRRTLQQSYYKAAVQLLPSVPAWGALAGVRPTKISTKHMLSGGNAKSADKLLRDVYYVTPERRKLAVDCSASTVKAAHLLEDLQRPDQRDVVVWTEVDDTVFIGSSGQDRRHAKFRVIFQEVEERFFRGCLHQAPVGTEKLVRILAAGENEP